MNIKKCVLVRTTCCLFILYPHNNGKFAIKELKSVITAKSPTTEVCSSIDAGLVSVPTVCHYYHHAFRSPRSQADFLCLFVRSCVMGEKRRKGELKCSSRRCESADVQHSPLIKRVQLPIWRRLGGHGSESTAGNPKRFIPAVGFGTTLTEM